MDIKIRRARPGEAEALTKLILRSKASWGYDAAFMEAAEDELIITEQVLQNEDCWVAEANGQTAGFLRMLPKADHAWLEDLFVRPEYFGQGIGKKLWEQAIEYSKRKGCKEMRLEADPNARDFYERLGAEVFDWRESTIRKGRMLPRMRFRVAPAS